MNPENRKFPRRSVLAIAVGLAVLGGGVALYAGQEPDAAQHASRVPAASLTVSVLAPAAATFDRSIAATGSIAARDELIVGSDASGVRLTDVMVDVGSVVHKGQLLALADDAELQAQLAQQDALIRQARAEHQQAQANLERADLLKDSGVYSVEVVQTRRSTAAAAEAKVELAQAQRRELEVKISHTKVVAPAAGVIARRSATVGAVIQPGAELFRLIRNGELEWLAELPAHSLARVQPGAAVRVALDDGRRIEARVRMVAPTIDAATRNGLLHVTLPAGTPVRAGGHARGEILVDSGEALAIPESSVITRDGYAYVFVVGQDDVARLTRIETGGRQQGLVEVVAGLTTEARVVGTGAGFVKDGELVRVSTGSAQRVASLGGRS